MIKYVPNLLSGFRLLLAPLAAWLVLNEHDTAALCVFALAALSDGLDGTIARRWGFTSDFGAWLDPAADKLLMLLCMTALFAVKAAPVWLLAVVVGRDAALAGGWLVVRLAALPITFHTLRIGKLSTLLQLLYVLFVLLLLALDWTVGGVPRAFALLTALVTAASGFAYARIFWRGLFQKTPAA